MKKKIYLCGPITGCTDEQAMAWRNLLAGRCPDYEFVDPMRRDMRDRAYVAEWAGEVIQMDLHDVRQCDILVRNCFQRSDGSAMEQFAAYLGGKHILLIQPEGVLLSPWTLHFANATVATVELAAEYINSLPRW